VETCTCNSNNGNGVCILNTFVNPPGIENALVSYANCELKCLRTDLPCLASNCAGAYCNAYRTLFATAIAQYNKLLPSCLASSETASLFEDNRGNNMFYGFSACSVQGNASSIQYSFVLALVVLLGLLF
jgi:hypothetical protein